MKIAGRFKPCAHMGCFDLEVFVELNQRSRKVFRNSFLCVPYARSCLLTGADKKI